MYSIYMYMYIYVYIYVCFTALRLGLVGTQIVFSKPFQFPALNTLFFHFAYLWTC